ncbi:MAG: Rrf2 family transcriptional regulator [Bacteroidetes bacterium]|nr:Rrf2 family transcriptional regulator [Bacteroidota bacterium]
MKFSSQEEFGMRLLLRIAKSDSPHGLTIPEISVLEGISISNAGKILRILRLGGFVDSARGQTGGYKLTKPPNEIIVNDVMIILGGKLYESNFCDLHAGTENICTNSIDCSIRSLWRTIQRMIDDVLIQISLQDLLGKEEDVDLLVGNYVERIKNLCV